LLHGSPDFSATINLALRIAIRKKNITLKNSPVGDYVTHIDHGIGRFGGLQKIQVENRTQTIKLVYADIVYVSIHSLHKISKYAGKDDGAQNL
jgi:transcription-repair coupling factor (superfamily II helicase)